MKLKSLLLGSAAAMIAVSSVSVANAADPVVAAEPEPMEYVKVCDTYGKGFFYIPGTENCIKFSGYVRSEFIYTDTGAVDVTDWRYRARLNIDVRNDTDWGVLRSQIRIQGDGRGGGDANAVIDRALISLGGFRLGYSDTFWTTNNGYGWGFAANDGYYEFDQAVFLDYTFKGNGFSATIGVQDSTSGGPVPSNSGAYDAYAGLSYAASWGRVAGTVIYDDGPDELAWKVSVSISAIENVGIRAWYMADSGGTRYVRGGFGSIALNNAIEWQWGVDISYNVNSQFTVWAGYTDADANDAGIFGLGARWDPVSGLSIRPEVLFGEGDYVQARLRVVRSF